MTVGASTKGGIDLTNGEGTWKREDQQPLRSDEEPLVFQQVDCDHTTEGNVPVIRIFGITRDGSSVCVFAHGFAHYFYLKAWEGFHQSHLDEFKEALDTMLKQDTKNNDLPSSQPFVIRVTVEQKKSLWGAASREMQPFLKIYVCHPRLVSSARKMLRQRGVFMPSSQTQTFDQSFETNVPYVLRFMIDKKISGGGWVEVPKGAWKHCAVIKTTCQIEVEAKWHHVHGKNDASDEWMAIAPLRILSFDIECLNRRDASFPQAEKDEVIQISNVVKLQGSELPIIKNIFVLGTCAPIQGVDVRCFKDEKDLLMRWSEFVVKVDPDLITGYNVQNFDFPYLLTRAHALKLQRFPFLGRVKNTKTKIKESTFSSKAYGSSTNKEINLEGRVLFDLYPIVKRDCKLRSYSLNYVSFHFLKQQKEDVPYSMMQELQDGDETTRRRLAVYCVKDSVLPLLLLDKLMYVVNYVEMARVTGVPIPFLISRGQQIKVQSQLLRKVQTKNYVIPVLERAPGGGDEVAFEGATVIEPKTGFYDKDCITTLDFASLYPSIMMAHNLCYSTLLSAQEAKRYPADSVNTTPRGDKFLKKSVSQGLLPEILDELLKARKNAKKLMKAAKDPFIKAVYNGRQLALKVSCNSVYGFTGALKGVLPCLSISASVTAYGRKMIDDTKAKVEELYTKENGYDYNAEVVYGDTDSVMIKFGGGRDRMAQMMALGPEAASKVTEIFEPPIKLEFEKVYFPYLLMAKKRYAGMLWTKAETWDYMDCKGIETVRRDNCRLVKRVVQEVLNQLLIHGSREGAISYAKKQIAMLLQNKIDVSDLVLSSQLGALKDYKNLNMPHIAVSQKMAKRDPLSAPKTGERVGYVYVQGHKGAKAYERAEDPLYVLQNALPLDTEYYLKNKLRLPLTRIFSPVLGGTSAVDEKLFSGDHVRCLVKTTSRSGALMRFAVAKRKCVGCGVPVKGKSPTCQRCTDKEGAIYMNVFRDLRQAERNFHKFWVQCQRCQGSLHTEVLCNNRDCPIFYRRTKAGHALAEARKKLEIWSISA